MSAARGRANLENVIRAAFRAGWEARDACPEMPGLQITWTREGKPSFRFVSQSEWFKERT